MNLAGKRVLVTGASGGIGHAIAREFSKHGATLVLTGRRAEVLEGLAHQLAAQVIVVDLADRAQVDHLIAEAGVIDIYVANAALPATGELTALTQQQIDTMIEVNLRAPIAIGAALAPQMAERHCGHMVFISSIAGKVASPYSSMYNATKFGLRGFALAIRQDLEQAGVGVSVVSPGFISDAGMFADAGTKLPPGVGTRTPQQVASAVIEAIHHDRAEVMVAPFTMRIGTVLGGVAPALSARVQKLVGGPRIARELSEAQVSKLPPAAHKPELAAPAKEAS